MYSCDYLPRRKEINLPNPSGSFLSAEIKPATISCHTRGKKSFKENLISTKLCSVAAVLWLWLLFLEVHNYVLDRVYARV